MVRIQCVPWIALALIVIVAGLDSASTPDSTAYARPASSESPAHSTAAVGITGRLSSPRLIGFPRTPSGTTPASVGASRFRTRDDAAFAADKLRSSLGSSVDLRALVAKSIPLASAATASTEAVNASFPGMSYKLQTSQSFGTDQRVWPPDTQIGVGSSQVVEFVNSSASIWSKSGQLQAIGDLNSFFILPVDMTVFSVSDPRIFYDSSSGIWFSSAMAFDASNDGRVYLNVSLSSDPAGFWYQYTIESNNLGMLYDQPRLGLSSDKVVMSWDDYSTAGFTGSETWVFNKAELIAGTANPSYWTTGADLTRFAVLPSTSLTPTLTEYVVYSKADPSMNGYLGYPTLGVVAITGSPVNNSVAWTESSAPVPGQAYTVVPPDAVQPSGAPLVATNDDRLLAAVWQNGILWVTANDGCIPVGDLTFRSCLRLFQLSTLGTSPAILQTFDVGSVGAYLSFPSIILDAAGNAFLGFSGSSLGTFPSFLTSAVPSGGGLLDAEVMSLLQPGIGVYVDCAPTCSGSPNNNNRWGDYGGAAIDPTDPTLVWLAGEFAASVTNPLDWGTGVAEVSLLAFTSTATALPTSTSTPFNSTAPSTPTSTNTPFNSTIPSTPTSTTTETPTDSPTASANSSGTSTPTDSPTVVASTSTTATSTPTPTTTETPTDSPTASATQSDTSTPTDSPTAVASTIATATSTPTPTTTETPTDSPTASATPSDTPTPTDSPTAVASTIATATSTTSPTADVTPTSTVTSTISPTVALTPTSTETSTISPTTSATATNQTCPVTATPTSSGSGVSPTATPNWIDVPVGQPTVVTTVVGALAVAITIPPGEAIARIAVSIPQTPVPIVPIDPTFHEVPGAAIVVEAVDSCGQPITRLGLPIVISIGFRVPAGVNANPFLAQIYTLAGGTSEDLNTAVTSLGNYGNYVATASTGHLSPFVIFAPSFAPKLPRTYLPLVLHGSSIGGW